MKKRPPHPRGITQLMPKGLALAAAGVIVVLTLTSTGAQATGGGRTAAACSNETVAVVGKPTVLRFVLRGVSCRKAHSLIRAYFRKASVQSCRNRGTACILTFPGGWSCSFTFAGEGPGFAGCARALSDRLEVYKVTRPPKAPAKTTEFAARLKAGTFECGLASEAQLVCQAVPHAPGGSAPLVQVATLRPDGRLTRCTEYLSNPRCFQGNFGDPIPSYGPGNRVVMARGFACNVLNAAVECTVHATGNGFRITPSAVKSVIGRHG